MTEKEMFEFVLDELMNCDLFRGKYDARNGDEHFMHGIATVMESIAYHAGDDVGDAFSDLFTKNLIESEDKVKSFYIESSIAVKVKAETVEKAYEKFYDWVDEIPETREVQINSVCVDDDQLRPEEDKADENLG